MTRTEFEQQMNKLLIFYKDPPEESEQIYWTALGTTDIRIFERACDIVLNTHKIKEFPMLPVFNEAIEQANRELSISSSFPSEKCIYCRGYGVILVDRKNSGPVVKPCTCRKGVIYSLAFKKASKKEGIYRSSELQKEEQSKDPY